MYLFDILYKCGDIYYRDGFVPVLLTLSESKAGGNGKEVVEMHPKIIKIAAGVSHLLT